MVILDIFSQIQGWFVQYVIQSTTTSVQAWLTGNVFLFIGLGILFYFFIANLTRSIIKTLGVLLVIVGILVYVGVL